MEVAQKVKVSRPSKCGLNARRHMASYAKALAELPLKSFVSQGAKRDDIPKDPVTEG